MLLYDQNTEMRVIRTIASTKVKDGIKSQLLASLTVDHFYTPVALAAFKRIFAIARKRSKIITFADLISDPALEEDFRDVLKTSSSKIVLTEDDATYLVEQLNKWRKARTLANLVQSLATSLKSDKVDIDDLLEQTGDKINGLRANFDSAEIVYSLGKEDNFSDLVDTVLNADADPLYKTGFSAYDRRSGGLPVEGVMVIAATTSGGKSALLLNLLKNIYLQNSVSVVKVSLEMGDIQETRRLMSNLSQIPLKELVYTKGLSPVKRRNVTKAYKEFSKHGRDNDCRFSQWAPVSGVNIEQILLLLQPYDFKVLAIDYITLLEGTDNDDQAKVLSRIVKRCKRYSRHNHCLVILLAQLDEESDKIRYSRAIKEHADVVWTWSYTKQEQRESKILPIKISKGRDQEIYNFSLAERFEVMTVEDISGEMSDAEFSEEKDTTGKKKKVKSEIEQDEEVSIDYEEHGIS